MHFVNESATIDRRQQRRAETASRLTTVSRRLTARNGLNGFTIEELCAEVGVSRRTFFNYFPSKEDAVIGMDPHDEAQWFSEEFVARGSRGWTVVIDDLIELAIQHFDVLQGSPEEHADFFAAVEREPKLLKRFIGVSKERERQIVQLVARREGVPETDLRAIVLVNVLFALVRTAGDHIHGSGDTTEFAAILTDSLAAARIVLSEDTTRKAQS